METREAAEFTREIESRLGSRMVWKTFAPWFASSDGTIREYGVFLCILEDGTVYLEDFERLPQILGIEIKSKKTPKYEKFSMRFRKNEVKEMERVAKKSAQQICRTSSRIPAPRAGRFTSLLQPLVSQIVLEDGTLLYFELIDYKAFNRAIGEI